MSIPRWSRARAAILTSAIIVSGAGMGLMAAPSEAATATQNYFVDCSAGNDTNSGTDAAHPWLTLNRVNSAVFQPGNHIRLRAGVTCSGTLAPRGSGTATNPIVMNSYGAGNSARIDGNGAHAAIFLHDVQGWEVRNLEVTNTGPAPAATQQRVGVHILLDDYGVGRHYLVANVNVHDVNGCDCRYPSPSGGVVFEAAGSAVPTGFDDVAVRNNTVRNVDRTGIGTFSTWQRRAAYPGGPGSVFMPMTNVNVNNNEVAHVGGDGVVILNGVAARVQRNFVSGFNERSAEPNVGMYAWNSDRTLFQYNEVANGSGIGMAFAIEGANDGTIYQYNFSHDNAGGFLYACAVAGETISKNGVIRYNLSQNDVAAPSFLGLFTLMCADMENTNVYANTFYAPTSPRIVNNLGQLSVRFTNNIFSGQPSGSTINDPLGVYSHNLNHNVSAPSANAESTVVGDPQLAAPGTAKSASTADGYQLRTGSPALTSGTTIAGNCERDYFGNPIPVGSPNIGAYQGPGVSG
jgi:hypothetical protein